MEGTITCPKCGRLMTDLSYWDYGIGSWDMDYPDVYHENHVCHHCNIKKVNGEWKVPQSMRASDKQIKCAEVISNVLGISAPECPLKTLLWKFINDNRYRSLLEAKRQQDRRLEDWCEDNQDWLPEYY